MSPVSSIYDHLTFNVPHQAANSRSHSENLHMFTKRQSLPSDDQGQSKRRYTVTNISIPETIRRYSVNNQIYDQSMTRNSFTTQTIPPYQQLHPKFYRIPASSSTIEIRSMDFRPLITNGRRKFSAGPASSSMIIIKKKSPPLLNNISYNQKPLIRSIPVDIINSNIAMVVSPLIPTSLSYSSSSSSSTSASSTNVGTVLLPIQVTKSQNNNNNNNNHIRFNINTPANENQRGYRYAQKYTDPSKLITYLTNTRNPSRSNDDLDQSTRIPSSATIAGEGCNYKSTIMMDSNVLRLIRRYDPVGSSTTGIIPRRSLENTRGIWHSLASKTTTTPQMSDSSPFLSRRSLTVTYEDEIPDKQPSTPRLQRQQAIHEPEPPIPPPPPPPPPPPNNSIRPILKYTSSRSRSEFIVQPHQTEPLTIDIDPYIPPANESPATYQPLITTGTKRVCSALSKSEWDLRLQQDQLPPLRPPSPSSVLLNQQQEKESYRPSLGRSKSSVTINHNNDQEDIMDDLDEISAPIISSGSCVEKLKQLFVTKSAMDLTNLPSLNDSIDTNVNRRLNSKNQIDRSPSIVKTTPIPNSTESPSHNLNKPTTIIQEVTPTHKKPIFRSQKTIDSPESVGRPNNNIQMPSSDLSYDAYRFRRLNDQDTTTTRPRNIAKVEPYSMNTNTVVRPLYQSSQPLAETTAALSKARINLNSMGNTPVNSSTSSSAGSLGGMIRHSDFLIPNPAYSKPLPPPLSNSSSSYTTPSIFLSDSLSHGSLHQVPIAHIPSYNGPTTGLPLSKTNSQDKYQSSITRDSHPSMHTSSPSLNNNNNNSLPPSSYHYRPLQNNNRQQGDIPIHSTILEQQEDNQQQQQSRRRFQRRKQMKRSKSVDLYQEPSAFITPNNEDLNKSFREPKSTNREHLEGGEIFSSSSSSSSLTADMERVNRAALLRYKSLDSVAFNNRKPNIHGRNPTNNRRHIPKPSTFDFDSDDSVCGIPKPRKLCTSSKNTAKSERTLLDSPLPEKDQRDNSQVIGSSGTHTGITNSVRKNETIDNQIHSTVESTPSTTTIEKREGEEKRSLAESQFYARTSNIPYSKQYVVRDKKETIDDLKKVILEEKQIIPKEEVFIHEPVDRHSSTKSRPLSNSIIINPFERLRPMDMSHRTEELSLQIFDQPSFPVNQNDLPVEAPSKTTQPIIPQEQFDDNNDSSTSTTTNRSVHLPVEKQRGLSEIIRKRNSKCKVEDYRRSIQKPNTFDDEQSVPPSSNHDHESIILPTSDLTPKYFDVPINSQNTNDQRAQMSIERLNLLLSKDEQQQVDEKRSVADKKNIFEIISKDTQVGGTLPRSKSFKNEDSPSITKKYADENQRSPTDNLLPTQENETYDDDISKLSFKEKMVLFNKKKVMGLAPTSSLKNNRNRLTQPITAEEVQAAANLTPSSSTKQLSDGPEESENIIPVSKRLEQFKAMGDIELKSSEKQPINEQKSRKTPTLKYNAKKTNTDEQQRAKTVDIVRLKADSAVKPKETTKTNGATTSKSNQNVISVLKSDTISVLKPDDHLEDFFADTTKHLHDESTVPINTDDLNRIAENTTRLQSQAPRVRPPRRQQQGAKNPLRQIQATIPTEDEYIEVHTNLSEQEVRRLKRAQIAENAGLAQEALAALAATENFAEINLRKIDQTPVAKFGYEPYKEIMLILIKGRRHCSLRLVNPIYQSINEGDCYLLITPLKVFAWIGRHANSYEKSRTSDLIDYLKQHRDFGLRNEVKYFLLDQGKDDTENDIHAEFRDILQGEIDDYKLSDDVIEDEFYERNITELNRVYRVENDLLMPLNEFCFRSLTIQILDPNEVFVFDFGAELYVWNGKYADKIKRYMGLQLAQQLWNDTYDASECIINPYDPLEDKNEQVSQADTTRPIWCIFGKQNQNVETLLFKGKFSDWPSDLQELKSGYETTNIISKLPPTQRPQSIVETLKPADVHQMLAKQDNPENLILEQINLGRGRSWYDPLEHRGHEITTISVHVWHINDNDRHELSKTSYGQFYSDDVYIIRWKYKLLPIGSERKTDVSRDRVAYWIWQGVNANLNEKGISALMTVFLNEEKGAHIHVIQEHEEAIFLQLFDGTLTIHIGKRNQLKEKKSTWRLYIFLGEIDVETHWWEININSANLRSRTSFLLVNNTENLMLLWHGCGTSDDQQDLAKNSVMKLRERCPEEFHFDGESDDIEFFEMQEGDEIELFWEGINERNHERKYYSLLNIQSQAKLSSTMRIFHLSSLHGPFVAQEFIYSLRSPDHIASFPFTQADLYELHQPALCLIDTDTELYIWQGWNDQSDDELGLQLSNANLLARGPRDIRFITERRCAFRTAIDYYKTKTGSSTVDFPCSIVYAGLEPIDFINLFPKWSVNIKARQQNQLEGKKLNQKDSVIDILNQLSREQYTIEELRARPLPEGVDPSKIESYLSNTDFQKEFHMTKDEFYALPYWKQTNIKKPLGFF